MDPQAKFPAILTATYALFKPLEATRMTRLFHHRTFFLFLCHNYSKHKT
jgi:hypothetical protein